MDAYETTAKYNIAETCSASISLDDLKALSNDPKSPGLLETSTKLTYGAIRGTEKLRSNIARLYPDSQSGNAQSLSPENVIVTPGAILANFLVLYTLVNPGDHVICHYPTYQQLYSVPESFGAEVGLWKTKPEDEWVLNVDELRTLVKSNTKLIILKLVHFIQLVANIFTAKILLLPKANSGHVIAILKIQLGSPSPRRLLKRS